MKNPLPKLHNRDKLFCYGTEKRDCHVRAFGKVTRGKVGLPCESNCQNYRVDMGGLLCDGIVLKVTA